MNKNHTALADHEIDRVGSVVRACLNAAEHQVDDVVAARLAAARHRAVAARQTQFVTAPASVSVGGSTAALTGGWGADLRRRLADWRFWAVGLAVSALIATYGARLWNDYVSARDVLDVDMMILGDDVPVDALLDKGFSHFVQEGE